MRDIAGYLAGTTKCRQVALLRYHDLGSAKYHRLGRRYSMAGAPEPSAETMQRLGRVAESFGLEVSFR